MNPEEFEQRMNALTAANLRLLKRVGELESRVARLEGRPAEEPAEAVPSAMSVTPARVEAAMEVPAREIEAGPGIETKVGLAWVNRVAVITCIFAAGFFFKYAADNEWIGPSGRVLLGLAAGLISILFADRFHGRGERTYAQGLCGLGASLLFLACYAAYGFYHLIPLGLAFALMAASIGFAGALALRYDARAIAALALAGGFLTPPLLATGTFNGPFFYAYLAVLAGAAVWLARRKDWAAIEALALAGVFVLTTATLDEMDNSDAELPLLGFLAVCFAVFGTSPHAFVFHAAQVLFPALSYAGAEAGPRWFSLTLTGLTAAGLWLGAKSGRARTLPFAYAAATISAWAWGDSLVGPDRLERILPLAVVLFLLFAGWIPWRLRAGAALARGDFAVTAANGAGFFLAVYGVLEPDHAAWLGLAALLTAGIYAVAGRLSMADARAALLQFGLALAFVTLAVPLQFEKFTVTMAWSVEAAALAWAAARMASPRAAYVSLAVFALAAVTLGSNPAEGGLRILSHVVVAAGLWFAASSFRTFPRPPGLAAIPYVTGHLVMLAGLGQEIGDWARRTAAPENVSSVASLGVSLMLALWSVALVSAGVASRSVLNRILGLALIGFVLAKLYLYDVWSLGLIYRVIAFGALGGTLLATSYLYSRYREKIGSLWQGENR